MCTPLTENKKRWERKDEGVRQGATDEGSRDVWASCWRKESVRGGDRWKAGREGEDARKEDVEKGEDVEEDCLEIVGLCGAAAAVAVLQLLSHPHSSSSVHIC